MIIHRIQKVNPGLMETVEFPFILNKMSLKIQFVYQPERNPYWPFIKNKRRN